jgi:TRAP-type C4-dicarboxylate transport system permease small subunit
MGKRRQGKPRRRKNEPITRRDPEKKRAQRDAKGSERDEENDDDDADDDEPEEDRDDGDDGEPEREPSPVTEPKAPAEEKPGAPWGEPLVRFERKWTWLEVRILVVALFALVGVLCIWVCLRGMKEPVDAAEPAGGLFRALLGGAVLAGVTRYLSRGRIKTEMMRNVLTTAAIVVGIAAVKLWRGVGVDYFAGVYDWLQEGSSITLMGGLLGVSTRLTMVVALVGGSLAAATGTHINVDVVLRLIPQNIRRPMHIASAIGATTVCLMVAWGMFDNIAVTEYGMEPERPASEKLGKVVDEAGDQFFIWRKQMKLDFKAFPSVVTGKRWNAPDRMNGKQWNELLANEGFVERFGEEKVAAVRAPEESLEQPWTPFVVVPGGDARGFLLSTMNLIFPLGFLMIGLRILLRALLVASRHVDLGLGHEAELAKALADSETRGEREVS